LTIGPSFQPLWASPPGETITDILRERGLSTDDLGRLLGESADWVNSLLEGSAEISLGVARKLRDAFGGSVEFWMSRDYEYRQDIQRRDAHEREWLEQLPVKDIVRYGWVQAVPRAVKQPLTYLQFFDVPSVQAWEKKYSRLTQVVRFKKSSSFDEKSGAVAAWLRQGEIEAASIKCGPWNSTRFRQLLPRLRELTRNKYPNKFVPELRRLCAECGVAVVIIRTPAGCHASGATWFPTPDKAILQLSFRYLTDDHFWFAFFHEAGHILLHGSNRLFLEGSHIVPTSEEQEANDFAESVLIPADSYLEFTKLHADARSIIRFASQVGISPGIVVGQLQHRNYLTHRQMNFLKRRFRWQASPERP
jgi:HTH-type transcriptional regulator / antitoxin HigA